MCSIWIYEYNICLECCIFYLTVGYYLPRNAVDVELDHVLPTGVVLWLASSVLGVDDAGSMCTRTHTHRHTQSSRNNKTIMYRIHTRQQRKLAQYKAE